MTEDVLHVAKTESAEKARCAAHPHPALPHYIQWELCDGKAGEFIDTHLQAEINCSYADLVAVFGKPNRGPHKKGDKVDASWGVLFWPWGGYFGPEPATIYNYKDGPNYEGKNGTPVTKIRDWHIGGKRSEVVGHIASMLIHHLSGAQRSELSPSEMKRGS